MESIINQLESGLSPREIPPLNFNNSLSFRLQTKKVENILKISQKYNINPEMANRLLQLRNYEIVIVCDDSGSMLTTIGDTQRTRWDELCDIVKIIVDIGVIFDSNGVDIYFLNGETFEKVKDPQTVEQAFAIPPSGYTPLVAVLNEIFTSNLAERGRDKKLLVFVATDGQPTNDDGNPTTDELKRLMEQTRKADTTYVTFLSCTDDLAYLECLNQWDKDMKNVDVTSNYARESEEVRLYRGSNYPFSYGDYIVKALVGAIDQEIDNIDEPQ